MNQLRSGGSCGVGGRDCLLPGGRPSQGAVGVQVVGKRGPSLPDPRERGETAFRRRKWHQLRRDHPCVVRVTCLIRASHTRPRSLYRSTHCIGPLTLGPNEAHDDARGALASGRGVEQHGHAREVVPGHAPVLGGGAAAVEDCLKMFDGFELASRQLQQCVCVCVRVCVHECVCACVCVHVQSMCA
jgi:hypothetical protein